MIRNVVAHKFCVKPLAAITLMNTGIHNGFWSTKIPNDIKKIYTALTATPTKVLSMLEITDTINPAEDCVVVFLNTMIGNMTNHEDLRNFLCFVTGASVCLGTKIHVQFNHLSGFARRPTSFTCNCVLVLPTDYVNYEDFIGDFKPVLKATRNDFAWLIDAL